MDLFLTLLEHTLSSPWLYLLVTAVVAVDATFPVVPAETLVITAGAYAAHGASDPALLIVAAGAGAIVGDHVPYQLGRGAGRASRWLERGRVGGSMYRWAHRGLSRRGGMVIVGARFIPGGRTATTLLSGVVRYPRARFILYSGIGGLAWAGYSAGVGLAGGLVFREQPLIGVAVGIGLALLTGALIELVRHLRRRRSRSSPQPEPDRPAREPLQEVNSRSR